MPKYKHILIQSTLRKPVSIIVLDNQIPFRSVQVYRKSLEMLLLKANKDIIYKTTYLAWLLVSPPMITLLKRQEHWYRTSLVYSILYTNAFQTFTSSPFYALKKLNCLRLFASILCRKSGCAIDNASQPKYNQRLIADLWWRAKSSAVISGSCYGPLGVRGFIVPNNHLLIFDRKNTSYKCCQIESLFHERRLDS